MDYSENNFAFCQFEGRSKGSGNLGPCRARHSHHQGRQQPPEARNEAEESRILGEIRTAAASKRPKWIRP